MIDVIQGVESLDSLLDSKTAQRYVVYEAARLALMDAEQFDHIKDMTGMDDEQLSQLRECLASNLPPLKELETA